MFENRWPPIYDFESLKQQIVERQSDNSLFLNYYTTSPKKEYCQGDIIELPAEFPVITENGDIAILDKPFKYWLIIGNSCDLARSISNEPYSNMIPLEVIDEKIPETHLKNLMEYIPYKKFYIPPWSQKDNSKGFFADFTKITTIDKLFTESQEASKVKEMNQIAWFLLHSCIVRYLARDDGRHD